MLFGCFVLLLHFPFCVLLMLVVGVVSVFGCVLLCGFYVLRWISMCALLVCVLECAMVLICCSCLSILLLVIDVFVGC